MDDRKRKRRWPSAAGGEEEALSCPALANHYHDSSSSYVSAAHTTASPCSPSYHLPQFLTTSSPESSFVPGAIDTSFSFLEPDYDYSCEANSSRSSITLSCGEGSLNSTLDDFGSRTPLSENNDSFSQTNSQWAEDSLDMDSLEQSPASSLSSSLTSSTPFFGEDLNQRASALTDEIYQEARKKEDTTSPLHISPEYYKTRPILVDWMLDVGDFFGFHGSTTHLAVAYLDRVLSMLSIERNKLQLVATACLLIAAKLEEIPCKVPTLPEFNDRTLDTYSADLIRTCERVILNHLEWNLMITTPRNMLDFFLSEVSCVSYDDLIRGVPLSYARSREIEEWAVAAAHSVMTMIVLDHQFLRFQPSILAAVCLVVARMQARIEPLWPARLEHKTGYRFNDLAECFQFTWALHESALAKQAQEMMEA